MSKARSSIVRSAAAAVALAGLMASCATTQQGSLMSRAVPAFSGPAAAGPEAEEVHVDHMIRNPFRNETKEMLTGATDVSLFGPGWTYVDPSFDLGAIPAEAVNAEKWHECVFKRSGHFPKYCFMGTSTPGPDGPVVFLWFDVVVAPGLFRPERIIHGDIDEFIRMLIERRRLPSSNPDFRTKSTTKAI